MDYLNKIIDHFTIFNIRFSKLELAASDNNTKRPTKSCQASLSARFGVTPQALRGMKPKLL